MLLVLALLAVAVVLVMEGYSATVQASAATAGADMISDALTEGRSDALAQNTTVEVRIYDLPPQPGATPVYGALQLHWLKADGTTPPVASPTLLPAWVVIDATPGAFPAHRRQQPDRDARRRRYAAEQPDARVSLFAGRFHRLESRHQLVYDRARGDPIGTRPVSLQLGVHLGRCHHGTPADLPALEAVIK